MAEATLSLSPKPISVPPNIHDAPLIHYPVLVSVLARRSARKAVEERMRNEGVRLSLTPLRIILEEANVYLQQHPELVQEAIERVRNVAGFRTLAEKEARDRARKRKQEMKRR